MDTDALEILLANRVFMYAGISRAFMVEPDDDFCTLIKDEIMYDECSLLDDEKSEAAALANQLQAQVVGVETLSAEYVRTFVGPAAPLASPYESVYVSSEELVFQPSTLEVREAYRAAGLQTVQLHHEPDDHIGTELDFLRVLAQRAMEDHQKSDIASVKENLLAGDTFSREHLRVWLPAFSDRLNTAHAEGLISAFYPTFAQLTILWLTRDASLSSEIMAVLR